MSASAHKEQRKNPNSIYDTIDGTKLLTEYFALVDAGKEEEAEELIKQKLPIPAYMSEAMIAMYGKDTYKERGFQIIERDMLMEK